MIWAWLGAAAVGLSLGLLGSGGAILTVPILVYLVGHDEKAAIAESLAIVGAIAMASVVRAWLQGRVDLRSAALLALPGILGASAGAHLATYVPGAVQLVLLAGLMLSASAMMFRHGSRPVPPPEEGTAPKAGSIALHGVGLGFATGLVGVGGGFLIVPVLVLVRRLPMSTAVGTSLAIISVNSTTGFLQYLFPFVPPATPIPIDWSIIGVFAVLGILGSLVGNFLAGRIYDRALKRVFACFLVVMAGYILIRQAPRVMPGLFAPKQSLAQEHRATDSSAGDPQGGSPIDVPPLR